jgi:hypothetical protein
MFLLLIYLLPICLYLLQQPDTDRCHSPLPWKIGLQVHLNAVSFLSKCSQFDFVPFHQMMSK